jgi:hypothetical protein
MNNDYKTIILENVDTVSGCPLCNAVMNYEFDLLSQLQYEIHNNESVRKEIAEEGGFCDFHFRQFKKIASGITNILLLKSLIESDGYINEKFIIKCRLCEQIDRFENDLINVLFELVKDVSFKQKFSNTTGLCFIHYDKIILLSDDPDIDRWLKELHFEQIKRTKADFDFMSGFKSYYEIDFEKRRLINIMIEKFAGRKTHAL